MDALPQDVLRQLSQDLDTGTFFKLPLVCKVFAKLFTLGPLVTVFIEVWDQPQNYAIVASSVTIVLGDAVPDIASEIMSIPTWCGGDWKECYHSWWAQISKADFIRFYVSKQWRIYGPDGYLGEESKVLSEHLTGHRLVAIDLCNTLGSNPLYSSILDPDALGTMKVHYQVGAMLPATSPFTPRDRTTEEIEAAFMEHLIADICSDPNPKYHCGLLLNEQREWFAVCYDPLSPSCDLVLNEQHEWVPFCYDYDHRTPSYSDPEEQEEWSVSFLTETDDELDNASLCIMLRVKIDYWQNLVEQWRDGELELYSLFSRVVKYALRKG